MMRILFSSFLLISSVCFGQTYWQQEVNYSIDVTLNDRNHTLSASETFEYINHSPDALEKIYIHLWPNAYRDGKTALAKQLYSQKNNILKYGVDRGGEPQDLGYIDSLDFKVNGVNVKWEYDSEHSDICVLYLSTPLRSGERITVSTPFKVKIPSGEISRLGHIGQSYQITQWYPKPAVYDKNGWNPIPYLNQGEFYSEFGSFDVRITLPKNYVLGATGDCQTPSEVAFLTDLARTTSEKLAEVPNIVGLEKFPESSSEYKTVRFTQSLVHDFAWFADKRYWVLKGEVALPHSKRTVTSWAMFTPQNYASWKNSIEYINDGTYYYSLWNGDYPYNNVTAVDGTISAGGGMEYPTITVIGSTSDPRDLEVVIVHEVGHNWFYGILGSNERVHGWMDEGMNTLNEIRYIQTKYPKNTDFSDQFGGRLHMNNLSHHDLADISYRGCAMLGIDQAIETHSAEFSSANYGAIMYEKTGAVFYYLKDYLGDSLFNLCMQSYFEAWKFKHPQPEDMRAVIEQVSGKKLDWLFNDLIPTTKYIDYAIKRVKTSEEGTHVITKNKGKVDGPIEVAAWKDGKIVETVWIEPGLKKNAVNLRTTNADLIQIDPNKDIPELYRQNNVWTNGKSLKRVEPVRFEFLSGDHEPGKTTIFWTPALAANTSDNLMIGAAFHNYGVPFNRLQYFVLPMYSTGRNMVSGVAEFAYSILPAKGIQTSKLGLSVKSFKYGSGYTPSKQSGSYVAFSPYWSVKFGNRKNSPFAHTLLAQGIFHYDINSSTVKDYEGAFARYQLEYAHPDHQVTFQIRNDYVNGNVAEMTRVSTEFVYSFRYAKKRMTRTLEIRGYYGNNYQFRQKMVGNTHPYSLSMSGADGQQDIFLEDYFFGRAETSGMWSQQRLDNMGGFKNGGWFGNTNSWIAATNVYVPLPVKGLGAFGVFADFGAVGNAGTTTTMMDLGLGMRIKKFASIYVPLYLSQNLENSFVDQNFGSRIRFSIKLNLVNSKLKLPF